MTTVAARMIELRKSLKLSQTDIAARLDIPRSTYANYETGDRMPSFEILRQLADLYNVSLDYLLCRIETPGFSAESAAPINLKYALTTRDFHWNGIPLNEHHIKPLYDLLEVIVTHRLKHTVKTAAARSQAEEDVHTLNIEME